MVSGPRGGKVGRALASGGASARVWACGGATARTFLFARGDVEVSGDVRFLLSGFESGIGFLFWSERTGRVDFFAGDWRLVVLGAARAPVGLRMWPGILAENNCAIVGCRLLGSRILSLRV